MAPWKRELLHWSREPLTLPPVQGLIPVVIGSRASNRCGCRLMYRSFNTHIELVLRHLVRTDRVSAGVLPQDDAENQARLFGAFRRVRVWVAARMPVSTAPSIHRALKLVEVSPPAKAMRPWGALMADPCVVIQPGR